MAAILSPELYEVVVEEVARVREEQEAERRKRKEKPKPAPKVGYVSDVRPREP